jgi:hypothetical protein
MHQSTAPAVALGSQGTYPLGGTTFVAPLPEDAYFDTNPGRMRLSHDGQHWNGSFIKVLRFMLADQLEDAPLSVHVSHRPDSEGHGQAMERVSGTLTAVTDANLVFEDGFTLGLDDILDIEF